MNFDKPTTENVRRLLALTGLTHEQLGKIAGVTRSSVSQWVRDHSEPRRDAIRRIAVHFGLNEANIAEPDGMKYVTTGADGMLHDDASARIEDIKRMLGSIGDNLLSDEESALIDMYRSLNEAGKKMAFDMVAALVKSGNFST